MSESAFSGLKVLDCTQGVAGPYCTKLLADFGAEVIKVEQPGVGDPTRRMGPFKDNEPHPEKSGAFFYLNTNKKSITLDFATETGAAIFKQLVKDASVLVESLPPGRMAQIGLSYQVLSQVSPGLIMTSISNFGQTGPYRDYAGNNLTMHGIGGTMYTMRSPTKPNERPVVEGGMQAEYLTGLTGFIATTAALYKSTRANGTWIDLSAFESVVSTLALHTSEYSHMGFSRRTNPNPIHGYPAGYSYPCADGWISITPGLGGTPNIALLIGQPELQDDPLFTKPGARMAETEKFDAIILPWIREHSRAEITREAQDLRLAFAPVLTPREILEDEQLKEREFFTTVDHPDMGKVTYPGAPAKLSEAGWRAGRAPTIGEHNLEIFTRLGYSKEDLVRLRQQKVI